MTKIIAFLIAASIATTALADGLPLKNGRYPGQVITFDLTKAQKATIAKFRFCHLANFKRMNIYTPYVFALTPEQSRAVRRTVGFAPNRFEVYETYRGFNDAGPHWNLALRYSQDRIEIPIKLLLRDKEAAQAHAVQGWEPSNPCFPALGHGT